MPLKSLNNHPPGSFQVYVPETGWKSTPYTGFNATVEEVQQHRKANPRFGWPTDTVTVARWVEEYTVARLRTVKGGTDYIIEGTAGPPENFPLPHRHQRRAVGAVEGVKVKKLVAGVSLVAEWLGSGFEPCSQEEANARAPICARCQFNKPAEGVQKVTGVIADGLQLLLEARASMRLQTPHDSLLHTCSICFCDLKLKAFAQMQHILEHTSKEVMSEFPDHCWIKQGAR